MNNWEEVMRTIEGDVSSKKYPLQLGNQSVALYLPERVTIEIDEKKTKRLLLKSLSGVNALEPIRTLLVSLQSCGYILEYVRLRQGGEKDEYRGKGSA